MENYNRGLVCQRIAAGLFSVSFLLFYLPFTRGFFSGVTGFELLRMAFSEYFFDAFYGFILVVALALLIPAAIIGYAATNSNGARGVMGAFGACVACLWFLWFVIVEGEPPLAGFWVFLGFIIAASVLSFAAIGTVSVGRQYVDYADYHPGYEDFAVGAGNMGFRRGASIVCIAGMYKGVVFPIPENEQLVLGRDAGQCHIVITENTEKVSRKHVSVSFDPAYDVYYVTDSSRNGTYLADGARLAANIPVRVRRGTTIFLANRANSFTLT